MSRNCKICSLPVELQNQVVQHLKDGRTKVFITKVLSEQGHDVSKDAIRRHKENHLPNLEVTVPEKYAKGTEPRIELTNDGGSAQTGPVEGVVTDYNDLLTLFGIDSTKFRVIDKTVRISKWQQRPGDEFLSAYKFQFEKIDPELDWDLTALVEEVRKAPKIGKKSTPAKVSLNTFLADFQIGKTGSRGGTKELLGRHQGILAKLRTRYAEESLRNNVEINIYDPGDIIEGFENVSSQRFTNDQSLMKQLETASVIISQHINLALEFTEEVNYIAVPSNHCGWRKGKDYLGTPTDDWGIFLARQIELNYGSRVTVYYPETYRKSLTFVEAGGLHIGVTHGDDFSPNKGVEWLTKQIAGNMPLVDCDVMVHGHYHNFYMQSAGRTRDNRQRWLIGLPTLDSGSDWFSNGPGIGDSDPGIVLLKVDDGKFTPTNLEFIENV